MEKKESKVSTQSHNQYLGYINNPSFQAVNRIFGPLFENNVVRTGHTGYFYPNAEIKYYNMMIDNFFISHLEMT